MSDISPISTSNTRRAGRITTDPASRASTIQTQNAEDVRGRGGARTSDQVEFSSVAQYLSQLQSEPAPRTDLINRVKAEISSETYLTDEKLSAAAGELLDDINLGL
tara:strand:+ start:37253 stop:37570 length:318 start_codon:yes stop_codon:yes gene_type:complete